MSRDSQEREMAVRLLLFAAAIIVVAIMGYWFQTDPVERFGILVVLAVIIAGFGIYCFFREQSPIHVPLSPDAERDARAKFMPSSDTAAYDAMVQPDKRGLKPGDR